MATKLRARLAKLFSEKQSSPAFLDRVESHPATLTPPTAHRSDPAPSPALKGETRYGAITKKVLFYSVLGGFLLSIHNGWLQYVLDHVLGVPWSAPIIGFFREETRGFLILFLVTLYLDLFRTEDLSGAISGLFQEIGIIKARQLQLQQDATETRQLFDKEYWTRLKPERVLERLLADLLW